MSFPTDRNDSGITAVTQFAGRIFYAGASSKVIDGDDRSPNIGTFIFYTQVIDSKSKYDKCYQEADPTSETISDLVDTDGGYIVVSGARRVFKLVPLQNSVVVFADNGVWQILGGDNGFSATGYYVSKITDVAADSKQSIVVADNIVLFWARGGIYVLSPNEVTPALRETNLTEQRIQTLYTSISKPGRQNARGSYDPLSREVRWLYNDSDTYDGVEYRHIYNKELIYNTVLDAFHVFPLSTGVNTGINEGVSAYFVGDSEVKTTQNLNVVVNGQQVVTDEGEDVVVEELVNARRTSSATKYLTVYNGENNFKNISFSVFNNSDFLDWGTTDAKSTLVTGYDSFGDTQRIKDIESLVVHCLRTENGYELDNNGEIQLKNQSSLLLTYYWGWMEDYEEFAEDTVITDILKKQAYNLPRQYIPEDVNDPFNYSHKVVSTKMAVKGSGEVLSLKFESEEGKDFHLLGYGLTGKGNAKP